MKTAEPTAIFNCPQCRRPVARGSDCFPFCSERCRATDLGRWAAGDYRIAGEAAHIPDESDSEY